MKTPRCDGHACGPKQRDHTNQVHAGYSAAKGHERSMLPEMLERQQKQDEQNRIISNNDHDNTC